jgi:hypothetical protein
MFMQVKILYLLSSFQYDAESNLYYLLPFVGYTRLLDGTGRR